MQSDVLHACWIGADTTTQIYTKVQFQVQFQVHFQVQTVQYFTRAAEFCVGGQPCQGLVPPRATWPRSRRRGGGPADTVRVCRKYRANVRRGRPAGGNGQAAAAAAAACCSRGGGSLQQQEGKAPTCSHPETCSCREEPQQHHFPFHASKALGQA